MVQIRELKIYRLILLLLSFMSSSLTSVFSLWNLLQSRIVMPLTIEEYEIGIGYTIMKMEEQNTNSQEGVEIIENKPFEDEILGKGRYASKLYHLQSKIPSWLKAFAPPNALIVQEESWSAYPKSRTVIKCPFFSKCSLTIESVNKPDNGFSENVHGLNKEQLALRQVEYLDIASISKDYWSKIIGANNVDLTIFKSQKTGRGPLQKGWMKSCRPMVTTYKLVIMDAPIWGIGEKLEDLLISGERALFWACHRLCFAWIDNWYGMNSEQISEMEKQKDLLLKKTFQNTASSSKVVIKSKHEIKRKEMQGITSIFNGCTQPS